MQAVLKFKKIKTIKQFINTDAHIKRKVLPANVDIQRIQDNIKLIGSDNIYNDFKKLIEDYQIKIRKNNVLGMYGILSASPEFFRDNAKDYGKYEKEKLDIFIKESIEYLKENFTDQQILSAEVHLDEATPHIEFIIIPLDYNEKLKRHRLNAFKFFTPKTLEKMQDDLFKRFQKYGFKPQLKTKNKTTKEKANIKDIKNYYKKINDTNDIVNKKNNDIIILIEENERLEKENYKLEQEVNNLKEKVERLVFYIKKLKNKWRNIMSKFRNKKQEEEYNSLSETIDFEQSFKQLEEERENEDEESKATKIKQKNKPKNSNKLRVGG